ncbi:Flp family type IVb pilin [Pleomorphomonas sp. NRK KF1]|uniref:Flp family type IVb pilin n=1 Tax=Pleomorphomonas sp. NRK KF1 TaxID=2943000 RepID=UPI0020448A8F|nr:Flp family type IVb pilin [Pleomorphomonas sp. NRK KF1]MCM5554374.1 Flp family type IVb pilin [Pleomorphomonas sp. NRK KF1]
MKALVSRFLKDESGATAIEYGLIASLIAVAIITAATTLGTNISATFNKITTELNKSGTTGTGTGT